ncbi:hypothetical protein TNIN_355011 [Trichonephila inaurata madagascariensis]|uniref:Uncharacterized protein n=1 Tax=Trichonephila inaurata madagascariensis TaxID=2747483 RepID=A0A8X7CAS2_9ARAC|nr:hypothetical protein TNIN_355011 [Trichonephila inaurata madagascariensis]
MPAPTRAAIGSFDVDLRHEQSYNISDLQLYVSTPCEWISTIRQLIAVTPDNPNRNAVETGSYTRWNNQAYGSVHRGTVPRQQFQSRGYGEQQHQHHHMVRFNERQQFNSQFRQFVQQNRRNFRPTRNDENIQSQG